MELSLRFVLLFAMIGGLDARSDIGTIGDTAVRWIAGEIPLATRSGADIW
jgi:hypothetical protein